MRIGIDVGGTFTDVIGVDEGGRLTQAKSYTTPADPSEGVASAIAKLLKSTGKAAAEVAHLVHGTTIGTNALLERKGVKAGLLTTAGFRDVLEIGRVQRPAAGLYDFNVDSPSPLVPRALRLEAVERVGADGAVVTPLDEASVRAAAQVFRREGVQAVAVCFLFSFLRPEHERRAREILEKELPGVYMSLSSEICPEFREFERTSTVVISAYLQPIVESYVERLARRVEERYPNSDLRIIQCNGGTMRAAAAKGRAVNLVNSGPAGGATAASFLARLSNEPKVCAVDMGGTSFDVSVIADGMAHVTTDGSFEGYPMRVAMSEVTAIGAGGGSIARVDAGGALEVGPQSAAAVPGPACYGRGGTSPTVTDANVVLGRISPDYFLGGEIRLRKDLAEEAIARHVAEPLGLPLEEAAYGILRVVNAKMAKEMTAHTIQRGHDPREFALLAFGGAGPLHAVDLAGELSMRRVVVPRFPGVFSAFGLLVADTRHDFLRTVMRGEEQADPAWLTQALEELTARGVAELEADGIAPAQRRILWSADLRFEGQSYELNVPIERKALERADVQRMFADFAAMHERIYAFRAVDEKNVIVNLRVAAIGVSAPISLPRPGQGEGALKGTRRVYFPGPGFVEARIYERTRLGLGDSVEGPAVVEEEASCTVVPPRRQVRMDEIGSLVIELT